MKESKIYKIFTTSNGVSIDSREELKGKMFFAIKGEHFDGNAFATAALDKGAIVSIVDDPTINDPRCILVENTLETLQELARYYRSTFDIPFIAITGSNGKTTTKELTLRILSEKYKVHATSGNFNNHIGVPLTLLAMPMDTEIAIIELGANHVGEIRDLCEIALPTYGLITNVGKAHLEGFGGFEGVIKAKTELYKHLEKNGGKYFINQEDNSLLPKTKKENSIGFHTFSYNVDNKGYVVNYLNTQIRPHLMGSYNVLNISAAATIGDYFGVTSDQIKSAIENYIPTNNRSEKIERGSNTIILDAYNANPSSMAISIKDFMHIEGEQRVLILGGMKELGPYEKSEHEFLVQLIESFNNTEIILFLVGHEYDSIAINIPHMLFKNVKDLTAWLILHPISDALVLIKGSRSNQLEKCIEAFTQIK